MSGQSYQDWMHMVDFSSLFTRKTSFKTPVWILLHTKPTSEKGSTLKGKTLFPRENEYKGNNSDMEIVASTLIRSYF